MADDSTPEPGQATVLDAAIAIAKAAEANAAALTSAAFAVDSLVEHIREQSAAITATRH